MKQRRTLLPNSRDRAIQQLARNDLNIKRAPVKAEIVIVTTKTPSNRVKNNKLTGPSNEIQSIDTTTVLALDPARPTPVTLTNYFETVFWAYITSADGGLPTGVFGTLPTPNQVLFTVNDTELSIADLWGYTVAISIDATSLLVIGANTIRADYYYNGIPILYNPSSDTITLIVESDPPVGDEIVVIIDPHTANVQENYTQQFTANVAVTWTTNFGTINSMGLYTAPLASGTATVTGTSIDDPTKYDTALVTVTPWATSLPLIAIHYNPNTIVDPTTIAIYRLNPSASNWINTNGNLVDSDTSHGSNRDYYPKLSCGLSGRIYLTRVVSEGFSDSPGLQSLDEGGTFSDVLPDVATYFGNTPDVLEQDVDGTLWSIIHTFYDYDSNTVVKSDNDGSTWSAALRSDNAPGLVSHPVFDDFASDPQDSNNIVVGSAYIGLWISQDHGDNWIRVTPDTSHYNRINEVGKRYLNYGTDGRILSASRWYNGVSWETPRIYYADPPYTSWASTNGFYFASNTDLLDLFGYGDIHFVITRTGLVYRSNDNGVTWAVLILPTADLPPFTILTSRSIAYDETSDTLFMTLQTNAKPSLALHNASISGLSATDPDWQFLPYGPHNPNHGQLAILRP